MYIHTQQYDIYTVWWNIIKPSVLHYRQHTSIYIRWKLLIVLGFYSPVFVCFVFLKRSHNEIEYVYNGLRAQKDWETTFRRLTYYVLL
jgi:hypothetical protein